MRQIEKLSWVINNACNLHCIHCYPDSGIEKRRGFTQNDFKRLQDSMGSTHFKRVFLSGGEPILDENFFEYLKIAKSISDDVYLCSNGTMLTDAMLGRLQQNGVGGIILSLQALSSDISEQIYGNASVPLKVLEVIERLKEYHFSFGVETTLMRKNINCLDQIVDALIEHDVKFISFKRLMPVGRGEDEKLSLSKEENYALLKKIYSWQVEHPDIRFNVHDPLYGTVLYDHLSDLTDNEAIIRWMKSFSCRAGTRWIGIDPFGNISPCPLLLYKDVNIGNVFEKALKTILEESDLIHMLQTTEDNTSGCCQYGAFCLGCRVSALSKESNFFGKDPMCVHDNENCPISLKRGS